MTAWFYLFVAAMFEVGWPVGLKMTEISSVKFGWIVFSVVAMILSGFF